MFKTRGSLLTVTRFATVAALGGFLFGYDSSVINGAVSAIGDHYHVSATGLGFTVSSALLGAAVGAVVAGRLADRFGRLIVMRLAAVLFLVSALGTGLINSLALLIMFRVLGGVGVGMASVVAPAYIAEIAPARIRGRLGSAQQLAIVLGIFVSLLADYALATAAGGSDKSLWLGLAAWRWMFLAMIVPAVIYGALTLTIPESPRYLVSRERMSEARRVLSRVLGGVDIDAKVAQIRQTVSSERRPKLADVRGPALGLMPIVWVGIGLSIFQQFVGINVIFYYSSVLWRAVGFSESSSLQITVISGAVNIVTTLVAIALIDKIGRKPLLLIGSAGMTVTLGVMAGIFGTATVGAHGQPVLHGAEGAARADRRERVRVLLRDVVGPRRMGHARREVPQPVARLRARDRRVRTMDRELGDLDQLPLPQERRARARLRHLRRLRAPLLHLRTPSGHRNQRPRTRTHVRPRPARHTKTNTTRSARASR